MYVRLVNFGVFYIKISSLENLNKFTMYTRINFGVFYIKISSLENLNKFIPG
jgi:hypothetical protein